MPNTYIPSEAISIGPRQRKKIESQPLADLVESIRKFGILHAPTFKPLPGEGEAETVWKLIVGERRTKAMLKLHEAKVPFYYNGELVPEGMLPVVSLHDNLTRADLKQVEFDENKIREQLPWQDEVEALAEIHKLRQEESGETKVSFANTATKLIEEGTVDNTSNVDYLATRISRATVLAENLNNPTIAKARNEREAYNLLIKTEEEKINASLARRSIAAAAAAPVITIRKGSCLDILPNLESSTTDLILTDPPFGIGANTGGFRQRTVHHHNYEDTPEIARNIAQAIILDGFRITKPMANLFIFCDIDLFPVLREMAARVGWVPFRTPIIWRKSMSEGMAPWQGKGFRRTYEMLFWATKGQRGLISSPVDVLDEARVSRSERTHAAEKPVGLLKTLIECSTLPGDFILDPCCGSGSTLVAARDTKRTGLGIEIDEVFYNTAMSNVYKTQETDTENGSATGTPSNPQADASDLA
jgi:DNA modification methylase